MIARPVLLLVLAASCLESPADEPASDFGGKGDVWGSDDRKERYEIETMPLKAAARSSAAMFLSSTLVRDTARDVWNVRTPKTLDAAQNLCDGQQFADQPAAAWCSATLIADDIMVTAGHCFDATHDCDKFHVVFDFAYEQPTTAPMSAAKAIPAARVYKCATMLARKYAVQADGERGHDYAVFRLDRKVTDRAPAQVNWDQPLETGQRAYVIGHPSYIPQKLAAGAVLDGTTNPDFVVHDADVFGGTSGGGLFDGTGTLIGVHVHSSGRRYVAAPTGGCSVVAVCGENTDCSTKPHAYDPRRLKDELSAELRMRLGVPPPM